MTPTPNRPEKVRQHTVPKHYLRGFTLEDSHLVQYDRDTGRQCSTNVDNASVVKRMYSFRRPDGQWDDCIEDYFMRLEAKSRPILQKLVNGHAPTKPEKCIFALYIARQMQRGHFMANFALTEAAKFKDHDFVLKMLEANRKELAAQYGEQKLEALMRDFKASGVGVEIDDKTYLRFLVPATPPFAAIIADLHWRIETASEGLFATSDQPPCVRRRGQPVNPNFVGLLETDAELYFPLDKLNMLIVSNKRERRGRKKVSPLRVLELNRITIINAFRFIFAPEANSVLESLVDEHKDDRIRFKEMRWYASKEA
ncbi:MAG: DUF4238 domain-containing protein [Planctomycetes bacterium]|nr:DUF4238 domain-containing protein [Planctomycetota bacterium]